MTPTLITVASVFGLWVLINMKKSRADAELVTRIHPYRKIIPYIMQGRNESVIYIDAYVHAENLLAYIAKARERFHVDVTHCVVAATSVVLFQRPKMNRFISGRRVYQRKDRPVTFSMKRKKLNAESKIGIVKLAATETESFREFCERINGKISVERSDDKTYVDKELTLFERVPRPVLNWAVCFLRWLDYHNLLPLSFIENDGMYTSVFIANLGSLGLAPAYHHLYEWGNCPFFMMVGKIEDRPMVEDGEVVVRKIMHIRWTWDERIEDGLTGRAGFRMVTEVLENPDQFLGCLESDGSDDFAFIAKDPSASA